MRKIKSNYIHPFHLVTPSPWPLIMSVNLLTVVVGGVMYLHFYKNGGFLLSFGFFNVILTLIAWWFDVIFEATYEGAHTSYVQRGLRYGMLLFIASEVMFFFAFFWAFFHSSLSPAIQIGAVWPPLGINVFNPWEIPLLNTMILLLSGLWATLAHHIIKYHQDKWWEIARLGLLFAYYLGITFTVFQFYEYLIADFTISDGIYGSVFYLATGFHGLHVIIGTTFLCITGLRFDHLHFLGRHYFGVDAAIWYWHFVDVVWLFLFVSIYWWGS